MPDDLTPLTQEKSWWSRFFARFAETGIVTTSAKAAGITRATVYNYLRDSPEFAARWEEAEKQAVGVLEDMATQRALKASDTMLIFLLKTRAPEKYGDRITHNLDAEIARLLASLAARREGETP